jgi:hypothetical protein
MLDSNRFHYTSSHHKGILTLLTPLVAQQQLIGHAHHPPLGRLLVTKTLFDMIIQVAWLLFARLFSIPYIVQMLDQKVYKNQGQKAYSVTFHPHQ